MSVTFETALEAVQSAATDLQDYLNRNTEIEDQPAFTSLQCYLETIASELSDVIYAEDLERFDTDESRAYELLNDDVFRPGFINSLGCVVRDTVIADIKKSVDDLLLDAQGYWANYREARAYEADVQYTYEAGLL